MTGDSIDGESQSGSSRSTCSGWLHVLCTNGASLVYDQPERLEHSLLTMFPGTCFILLARTYRIADMSQSYPLLRATAPCIIASGAAILRLA